MKRVVAMALTGALAVASRGLADPPPPLRFALIIGHNGSLDAEIGPLTYADDDAAKTYEVFQAGGADTALFTVLDPIAQRRHAEATAVAQPPSRAAVMAGAQTLFARMRAARDAGHEVHFYLFYSGHGTVGPNREGSLTLLDSRLRRSELYRELVAPSPATFNHLLIDACHADLVVRKRGSVVERAGHYEAAARDFLKAEDLTSYPNTGVLFATSTTSETHEWSLWEAGVFSHELRSGLLGAADVDGDGQVTYLEAGAFVEAANAAVDVPQARLRVWAQPPATRNDVSLFDVGGLHSRTSVLVGEGKGGTRYHIEDSRGVRVADFHPSAEQAIRVSVIGAAPFYLRSGDQEATVEAGSQLEVAALEFRPVSAARRGSAEASFRRHLFAIPFGLGFFRGLAAGGRLQAFEGPVLVAETTGSRRSLRPVAVGAWVAAASAAVCGGVMYGLAAQRYSEYQRATELQAARNLRAQTERFGFLGAGCAIGAGVLAGTGGVVWWLDSRTHTEQTSTLAIGLTPSGQGVQVHLGGTW